MSYIKQYNERRVQPFKRTYAEKTLVAEYAIKSRNAIVDCLRVCYRRRKSQDCDDERPPEEKSRCLTFHM